MTWNFNSRDSDWTDGKSIVSYETKMPMEDSPITSRVATIRVAVLTLTTALISGWALKIGMLGPVGLWGFKVAQLDMPGPEKVW